MDDIVIRGTWYAVRRTWNISRRMALFALIFLTTYHLPRTTAYAAPSQLKEANRQFKNGNYEKALKLYDDALIDSPHSPILHFNAGDAAVMMGNFGRAENEFNEAARSGIPVLRGASHYNKGNALFVQQRYDDAIEAYKESLRANPHDEDAKYNLGVALRTKQNPPKQPPKSGNQGNQGNKGKNDKQDKSDKGAGKQAEQTKPGQMSKEDAERLLSAAGAGEMKKPSQKAQQEGKPQVDEDW
jgi:Ca-activated chloride channel homolog